MKTYNKILISITLILSLGNMLPTTTNAAMTTYNQVNIATTDIDHLLSHMSALREDITKKCAKLTQKLSSNHNNPSASTNRNSSDHNQATTRKGFFMNQEPFEDCILRYTTNIISTGCIYATAFNAVKAYCNNPHLSGHATSDQQEDGRLQKDIQRILGEFCLAKMVYSMISNIPNLLKQYKTQSQDMRFGISILTSFISENTKQQSSEASDQTTSEPHTQASSSGKRQDQNEPTDEQTEQFFEMLASRNQILQGIVTNWKTNTSQNNNIQRMSSKNTNKLIIILMVVLLVFAICIDYTLNGDQSQTMVSLRPVAELLLRRNTAMITQSQETNPTNHPPRLEIENNSNDNATGNTDTDTRPLLN